MIGPLLQVVTISLASMMALMPVIGQQTETQSPNLTIYGAAGLTALLLLIWRLYKTDKVDDKRDKAEEEMSEVMAAWKAMADEFKVERDELRLELTETQLELQICKTECKRLNLEQE